MSHAAHPSVWMPMKLDIFLQNLKYTLRTLGRDRGFTLVSVLHPQPSPSGPTSACLV